MKKWWVAALIFPLLIAGTVLAGGCAAEATVVEGQTVIDVSAQEAYGLAQENRDNPDFIILDVRTPEEYDEGHIEGAINLNFYEADFRGRLEALDRDDTYILHCRSGNRSGQTLDVMIELEFLNIYHMTGGTIEWEAEGLPMAR